MEEWMPSPGTKRPRSPVEKLQAEAQGEGEDDHWRSSKRYFTEVIASGFSKLTFGIGFQQQQQQHHHHYGPGLQGCPPPLQHVQQSPRDTDMDMLCSPVAQTPAPPSPSINRQPDDQRQPGSLMLSPTGAGGACGFSQGCCSTLAPPSTASSAAEGAQQSVAAVAAAAVLQPKLSKHAEKPPNSPTDLPASGGNLRKVALLRSLLVRTEQHLQHQEQQQQPLQTQQDPPPQQQEQAQQQQHQQPGDQQQQQQQRQDTGGTQRLQLQAGSMCERVSSMTSDMDMDCSSSSLAEALDSDGQHLGEAAAAAVDASDPLLCTEVLPLGRAEHLHGQQQQQKQQEDECCSSYNQFQQLQHSQPVPFADQQHALQAYWGPQPQQQEQQHMQHQQQQQQHIQHQQQQQRYMPAAAAPAASAAAAATSLMPPPGSLPRGFSSRQALPSLPNHQQQQQQLCGSQEQPQQQQQQQPQHWGKGTWSASSSAAAVSKAASPELSRDRLEALRAKALASTSRLTANMEPDDLRSLMSLSAGHSHRRGSADHTPSMLHSTSGAAAAAAAAEAARRRSSHI